jgi:hypothetical protein
LQGKSHHIPKRLVWGVSCQAAMDLPVKVRPG